MNAINVCFDCAFPQPFLIGGLCGGCHRRWFDGQVENILAIEYEMITVRFALEGWLFEVDISLLEWNYLSTSAYLKFRGKCDEDAYANYLEWDKSKAKGN